MKGIIHPKLFEKIGFATGLTIIVVGYGVQSKRRRLSRIESKLDNLTEVERDS